MAEKSTHISALKGAFIHFKNLKKHNFMSWLSCNSWVSCTKSSGTIVYTISE